MKALLTNALNDYIVTENDYYHDEYHVTSRDLTDGRTNTGGWGSATAKTGNYIQATFARSVYVTSVTVAGGFIPSWDHVIRNGYGKLNLQYSTVGKKWTTVIALDIATGSCRRCDKTLPFGYLISKYAFM